MRYILSIFVSAHLLAAAGCVESEPPPRPATNSTESAPAQPDSAQPDSIGQAWLDDDGTLMLQLRAEGPGGVVGDALIEYSPDDEEYESTLRHIGGLKKGEIKPVPPWPDEKSKNQDVQ